MLTILRFVPIWESPAGFAAIVLVLLMIVGSIVATMTVHIIVWWDKQKKHKKSRRVSEEIQRLREHPKGPGKSQHFDPLLTAMNTEKCQRFLSSGHIWEEDGFGDIDIFANGKADPHNGPKCLECGYDKCWHCYPEPSPCRKRGKR